MVFPRSCLLLLVSALLVLGAGCSKSGDSSSSGPINLEGAPEVISALDRGDFETTVASLAKVKATVTEDKKEEYRKLLQRVKDGMVKAMSTNEAAVKAYQALRFLETGR